MQSEFVYIALLLATVLGVVVVGVIVVLRARSRYFGSDDSPPTLRRKHPRLALVADIIGIVLLVLAVWYIATRQ